MTNPSESKPLPQGESLTRNAQPATPQKLESREVEDRENDERWVELPFTD